MEQAYPYQVQNPMTGERLLVSPQRMSRPWQGKIETVQEAPMAEYDQSCYLCPGNTRNTGDVNPNYEDTYAFPNDYPTLLPKEEGGPVEDSPLFRSAPESGACEVLCYSPVHSKTMVNMDTADIGTVIRFWRERYQALAANPDINHVQIFESRGPEVGASNAHPHAQIWAQADIPNLPAKEFKKQGDYFLEHGSVLLLDYAQAELERETRVVHKNEHFITVVPYWAFWPYETMILPTSHAPSLNHLSDSQVACLAESLSVLTRAYAEHFQRPLYGAPYTMGIHQIPTNEDYADSAQLHIHFEPPLLTPTRQKLIGGYERFAQPQRDITAERAADELRHVVGLLLQADN